MGIIDRLIAAGLAPAAAVDAALWFRTQGDDESLEDFIFEAARLSGGEG